MSDRKRGGLFYGILILLGAILGVLAVGAIRYTRAAESAPVHYHANWAVFVDGQVLIHDWKPGESRVNEADFSATGRHEIRIVHFQTDGWYELRLDIERVR